MNNKYLDILKAARKTARKVEIVKEQIMHRKHS